MRSLGVCVGALAAARRGARQLGLHVRGQEPCAGVWAAGDTALLVGEGGRGRGPTVDVTTASLPREDGPTGPTEGTAAVRSPGWTVGAWPPHLSTRNLKETLPVLQGAEARGSPQEATESQKHGLMKPGAKGQELGDLELETGLLVPNKT